MKTIEMKAFQLKSQFSKAKGLIGSKEIYPVFLKTHFGIHTFGMKKPIDVIILEKNIVKILRSVKPNRVFLWNPIYSHVLELPFGSIKKKNISLGDKVEIILEK